MNELLMSAFSGVVASVFIWIWQLLLRPSVKAAPNVLVNGKLSLKIKNMTLFRSIVDVKLALFCVTHPHKEQGNNIADFSSISIKRDEILEMKQRGVRDNLEQGAWVVRGLDDFTYEMQDDDYIRLQVIASETLFGFRRIFTFDYNKADLKKGIDFERGRSLNIRTI